MLNRFKQQGLTLIELIMVMVVLAIGLSGVIMVMITMTSFSMSPVISWQAAVIGDNAMQALLAKEFPGFEECSQAPKNSDSLCEYIQKTPPMKSVKKITDYSLTITIDPFLSAPEIAQINVMVDNPHTGKTVLSALKAPSKKMGRQT